eukprot:scaffold13094_cov70-Phaeocystis_antarctica.AAC.9
MHLGAGCTGRGSERGHWLGPQVRRMLRHRRNATAAASAGVPQTDQHSTGRTAPAPQPNAARE